MVEQGWPQMTSEYCERIEVKYSGLPSFSQKVTTLSFVYKFAAHNCANTEHQTCERQAI